MSDNEKNNYKYDDLIDLESIEDDFGDNNQEINSFDGFETDDDNINNIEKDNIEEDIKKNEIYPIENKNTLNNIEEDEYKIFIEDNTENNSIVEDNIENENNENNSIVEENSYFIEDENFDIFIEDKTSQANTIIENNNIKINTIKESSVVNDTLVNIESQDNEKPILNITEYDIFDWKHYLQSYDDLREKYFTKDEAWNHWCESGKIEGRIFFVLENEKEEYENWDNFNWEKYIKVNVDLHDHITCKKDAWDHWIYYGKKEGRKFYKIKNFEAIYIFDWKKYISENEDLQKGGLNNIEDAWDHWINFGKFEGRKFYSLYKNDEDEDTDDDITFCDKDIELEENESFDWETYINNYPDLVNNGINDKEKAIEHWNKYGKNEGRIFYKFELEDKIDDFDNFSIQSDVINIVDKEEFDWETYINNYPDLMNNGINNKEKAIEHWNKYGKNEGRIFIKIELDEDFDWEQYINNYDDLINSGINNKSDALDHWLKHGKNEGRTYKNIFEEINEENIVINIEDIDDEDIDDEDIDDEDIDDEDIDIDEDIDEYNQINLENAKEDIIKDEIDMDNIEKPDDFNWEQYLENYEDLFNTGIINEQLAIEHWNKYGKNEGRTYYKIPKKKTIFDSYDEEYKNFDWLQYIENYDDLKNTIFNKSKAWIHWVKNGKNEGRTYLDLKKIPDDFNWTKYIKKIKDNTLKTKIDAWMHYQTFTKPKENLKDDTLQEYIDNVTFENFDWKTYINNYDDLKTNSTLDSKEKAWYHWINYGKKERRILEDIYKKEENDYNKNIVNNNIIQVPYDFNSNIFFKIIYNNYGKHLYGWKGVIQNFLIEYFNDINNKNKIYAYDLFFDEWIEKLLLWGNKTQNKLVMDEILYNNKKLITFIHNPPFEEYFNLIKYIGKENILKEIILGDELFLNKYIFDLLDKKLITDKICFLYTLSIYHKKFIFNNYKKYQTKLLSIYHCFPLSNNINEQFNYELFLENKNIYHIGWWLRNFKSFIKLNIPSNFNKNILVKNDFKDGWNNNIAKNYDLYNIDIINEISDEDYKNIFKNSVIFIDLLDNIANNTILECISYNTPIITNKTPSSIEYLGKDYPLFFENEEDLNYFNDEDTLLFLIKEAHNYLQNMDKSSLDSRQFYKKITYDLNKLENKNEQIKLTWFCIVHNEEDIDKCKNNFLIQDSNNNVELVIIKKYIGKSNNNEIIEDDNIFGILFEKFNDDNILTENYEDYVHREYINKNISIIELGDNNFDNYYNYCISICKTPIISFYDVSHDYENNYLRKILYSFKTFTNMDIFLCNEYSSMTYNILDQCDICELKNMDYRLSWLIKVNDFIENSEIIFSKNNNNKFNIFLNESIKNNLNVIIN